MEYTLADAARTAKVNRSTLFRAIKAGRLSARRLDDGTYRVDASELARVYELQHIVHNVGDASQYDAQADDAPATAGSIGVELAVLRVRVQMLEAERERWDRERETILEDKRGTVDDLRKRLDRAEERVLALSAPAAQPAPSPAQEPPAEVEALRRRLKESEAHIRALVMAAPPAPPPPSEAAQDAFSVVEELRRRREESKAVLRVLETPASQAAQERPSDTPVGMTPAGPLRRFLGRLLGG